GIRDGHVTGVQTCALPISRRTLMTVHSNSPAVRWGQCGKRTSLVEPGILAAGIVVAALGLHSGFSFAAESAGAPAMAPVAAPPEIGRASCRERVWTGGGGG